MLIIEAECPHCGDVFIVDRNVWAIEGIDLRCPGCQRYFHPADGPGDTSREQAARASVPLTIWRSPERPAAGS